MHDHLRPNRLTKIAVRKAKPINRVAAIVEENHTGYKCGLEIPKNTPGETMKP
jgi:hypothetical protein